MENVRTRDVATRLMRAVTTPLSMPPERNAPTGTSLSSRLDTADRSADSSIAVSSSPVPDSRCRSPSTATWRGSQKTLADGSVPIRAASSGPMRTSEPGATLTKPWWIVRGEGTHW